MNIPASTKTLFRLCAALSAALLLAPAHAQVIEEDEVYSTAPARGDFFGRLSGVSAPGSSTTALYQALQIGYDTAFAGESGRFYFSGLGSNTDLDLDLVLKDSSKQERNQACITPSSAKCMELRGLEDEQTITIAESAFDVRDAFLQFDLPGAMEFTLGRRRLSWGQFDLFSPINLALPLTPQSAEPVIDKISSLVAQDQVGLAWFPGERMEIQAYQFYGVHLDPLIERILELQQENGDELYSPTGASLPSPTKEPNDFTDHDQTGGRILFYPGWGILGFTYLDGVDTLSFGEDLAKAELVNGATDVYNVINNTDLPEAESFGFELAIPAGNWTWKFEYLQQESFTDISGVVGGEFITRMIGTPPEPFTPSGQAFYNAVFNADMRSGGAADVGKLYVPVERTLIAFGADVETDNWRLNLMILGIDQSFDTKDEELLKLGDAAFGTSASDRESQVAPTINIARYLDGDKQRETGFLAGFLGTYFGASFYYTSTIGDNFRWTLSAEAISNLRDDLAAETNADGNRYELADDISSGGRFSFIYNF
ncbi:MAG: hypothetical protein MPK11_02910 [Gammaproteobacteria bacterium]|nr:hypothetical protein [Gammaproteobacteria bacterium]MDA7961059.1 hypothetical protein [Gammaproteobacteria bacterium]MDA7969718.1 hypothetical protein [Gammaproteobacteria bacterium]MDA8023220.1 hypothetical protein [Gammaproteobacteria bacterium]